MQAAQILQQQASPTAPGPQGQQPTVASQVQQAASRQVMPDLQQVGQQAGLAGQLMAQQQQQQQQAAQNPQAVAQMAAQMLKQGVGGLPSNMQFKEGGIIGYAGPDGSDVRVQPIPDRDAPPLEEGTMAERAIRQLEEKGSIYDPFYGLPPEIRRALEADRAAQREGTAKPESYSIPGPAGTEEIPRTRAERERLEAQQKEREDRLQAMRELQARRTAQRQGIESALETRQGAAAQAGGAKQLEEYYTPYPKRGEMKATDSKPDLAAVLESEFQRGKEAGPTPREAPAPEAPPKAPPSGIAATEKPAAPPSAPSAAPTFSGILAAVPKDADLAKAIGESQAIGQRMVDLRKRQEDLAAQGIAALQRSEGERKRLLEQQKSEDSFNALMALARSFRTRGNEFMAYNASIKARDEADRMATLSHEDAVLKLKQAQQAREMGDLELEKKLKDEAIKSDQDEKKYRLEVAKATATLTGTTYTADVHAATSAANRAQEYKFKIKELEDKATERRDLKLRDQISLTGQRIAKVYKDLDDEIAKQYPLYNMTKNKAFDKLTPDEKSMLASVKRLREQIEAKSIAPLEAIVQDAARELGLVMPATSSSSGIDFSSLPKK